MFFAKLNDGNTMPLLGYGTYKVEESFGTNATQCVLDALQVGYRHIDTATLYKNEKDIGNALSTCGIDRHELFLTDKLWTNVRTGDDAKRTVDGMLAALKTDYLDLLLIHWPTEGNIPVWRAMEELHAQGVLRSIGVSNFLPHHIDELLQHSHTVPAVNQVELHPLFQQKELRTYCQEKNILVEAWSPLMRGNAVGNDQLTQIAEKHGKSAAQIIIRYDLQLGISVLPKTVHTARMKENFDVFDFELSAADMETIAALDQNARQYRHPDHHGY